MNAAYRTPKPSPVCDLSTTGACRSASTRTGRAHGSIGTGSGPGLEHSSSRYFMSSCSAAPWSARLPASRRRMHSFRFFERVGDRFSERAAYSLREERSASRSSKRRLKRSRRPFWFRIRAFAPSGSRDTRVGTLPGTPANGSAARFRQRVVKYFYKHGATKASIRFKVCRQSVYNWAARYDGTWKSLVERSHRPHHHPKEHTQAEKDMILRRYNRYEGDLIRIRSCRDTGRSRARSLQAGTRSMRRLLRRSSASGRGSCARWARMRQVT